MVKITKKKQWKKENGVNHLKTRKRKKKEGKKERKKERKKEMVDDYKEKRKIKERRAFLKQKKQTKYEMERIKCEH